MWHALYCILMILHVNYDVENYFQMFENNACITQFLFDMISLINPRIKYKLNKLLGDEYYSSAKLEALGFKAQKTLKDMNETSF